MVKLIRNVLASKQMFYNAKNEPIKWAYITQLEIVQTEEGLTLANKLRSRHVQYMVAAKNESKISSSNFKP